MNMRNHSTSAERKPKRKGVRGRAVAALSAIMMLSGAGSVTAASPESSSQDEHSPLQIIVTAPGSSTVYSSTEDTFSEDIKRSLRIFQSAEISQSADQNGQPQRMVNIKVGGRDYNFKVADHTPVVRFDFDRNRRALVAKGLNALESDPTQKIVYPTYKGTPLTELWALWREQIQRNMQDRYMFEEESIKPLVLEVDIDEDGYLRAIQDLGGTGRDYSEICVSTIFDIAARDWVPAQINGEKVRAKALIILYEPQ